MVNLSNSIEVSAKIHDYLFKQWGYNGMTYDEHDVVARCLFISYLDEYSRSSMEIDRFSETGKVQRRIRSGMRLCSKLLKKHDFILSAYYNIEKEHIEVTIDADKVRTLVTVILL